MAAAASGAMPRRIGGIHAPRASMSADFDSTLASSLPCRSASKPSTALSAPSESSLASCGCRRSVASWTGLSSARRPATLRTSPIMGAVCRRWVGAGGRRRSTARSPDVVRRVLAGSSATGTRSVLSTGAGAGGRVDCRLGSAIRSGGGAGLDETSRSGAGGVPAASGGFPRSGSGESARASASRRSFSSWATAGVVGVSSSGLGSTDRSGFSSSGAALSTSPEPSASGGGWSDSESVRCESAYATSAATGSRSGLPAVSASSRVLPFAGSYSKNSKTCSSTSTASLSSFRRCFAVRRSPRSSTFALPRTPLAVRAHSLQNGCFRPFG